jgi:hypothetical protein
MAASKTHEDKRGERSWVQPAAMCRSRDTHTTYARVLNALSGAGTLAACTTQVVGKRRGDGFILWIS